MSDHLAPERTDANELDGRVALITGGASGIGLGIARLIAERGGRVGLFDISRDSLDRARASMPNGSCVETYIVDVSDRDAVADAVGKAEADLGPVYALFNNAGVIDSVSPSRMRGALWDWVIDVNLHGVYNGIQAVVPNMIARGEGGYVVNTSSMAGLIGGSESGFAYHASKFAVVGLTESLRDEVARHGISVSVICPGPVATDIVVNTRGLRPDDAEPHSSRVTQILDTAHDVLHEHGVDVNAAARSIVDGMLNKQLYLFTDGSYGPAIEARTANILTSLHAAYPPQDNHDSSRRI